MTPSHGGPRHEPGSPPVRVWLGVDDAELLRYLRMVLAAEGPALVRECAQAAEAEVVIADTRTPPAAGGSVAPVLFVGGRGPAGADRGAREAHLPSPFNGDALLAAIRALAGAR